MRAAYHFGVRLWEEALDVPGFAERSGAMEYEGVRRTRKGANPESPNVERPVSVRCAVRERAQGAVAGYETGTAIDNTLYTVEAALIGQMGALGPVALTEDESRRAAVAAGASAGAAVVVTIGTPGGAWVPAAGHLVLFRRKSTGEGFTATIASVGAGTITCLLPQAITTAWEVLRVDRVFASCAYRTMERSPIAGADDPELHVPEVTYRFACFGAVTVPTASVMDHDA